MTIEMSFKRRPMHCPRSTFTASEFRRTRGIDKADRRIIRKRIDTAIENLRDAEKDLP